jgi:two-component system, NtrC family, sensor histidine kinase HydH
MEREADEPREGETAPPTETEDLLTRLAGGLAHEIKNPLSTMAINLTLLEEEWSGTRTHSEPSPREKRSLKRVRTLQREVSRLEGILDDFLHFTRGGEINRAPVDLVGLLREVIAFLEPEHELAGVRVYVDLPNSLPMAMLDEGLFRQAVLNLMVNARQAMPGGGELIVRLERVGSRAQLSITDTGVGMDEDELERCFELYWSTKKGGTGLGLATVSRIVQLHGGTMHVLSEKGRGTSFTLTLPLLVELARRPGATLDE